ncbi:pre-mRNA-splicing factor ATP-dependent RNA helicase DEAH10, partial [Tanacetum coccineum]
IDMSDLQTYISTTNSKSDKAVKLKAQATNKPERIQLTTEPNDSKALILASQFGCLEEILIVVSMLSVESIFYVLRGKLEEIRKYNQKIEEVDTEVFSSQYEHPFGAKEVTLAEVVLVKMKEEEILTMKADILEEIDVLDKKLLLCLKSARIWML